MTWVKGEPVIYLDERPTHWLAIWKETTMFRDSTFVRPLYEVSPDKPLGSPQAWRCLLKIHRKNSWQAQCPVVTRSQRGMLRHLRIIHGVVLQGNLFGDDQSALAPGHTAMDNGIQIDALRSVPEAKK